MKSRLLRRPLLVLAAALLAACGGGHDAGSAPPSSSSSVPTKVALAAAAEPSTLPVVVALRKTAESRVSRTVYDYSFAVEIQNAGIARNNLRASVRSDAPGVTVLQDTVAFGPVVAPGAKAIATGVVRLRVDRTVPFDPAKLQWTFRSDEVAGRVIDGYIEGAFVYWDCNSNDQADPDEAGVLTGPGGLYVLADRSGTGCKLLARVDASAVDADTETPPGELTLQAVPGRPELITPLSTVIAARMRQEQRTTDDIERELQQTLGLNTQLLVDYKAQAQPSVDSAARLVMGLLRKPSLFTTVDDTATQAWRLLQASASEGLKAQLAMAIRPYRSTYTTVADRVAALADGDDTLRVVRRFDTGDAEANASLDAVAALLNQRAQPRYGRIHWSRFSPEELELMSRLINRVQLADQSTPYAAAVQALRQRRTAAIASLSDAYRSAFDREAPVRWTDPAMLTFFSNDPAATVDALMTVTSASLDTALDVVTIAGTKVNHGKLNFKKYGKRTKERIDIASRVFGMADCVKALWTLHDEGGDVSGEVLAFASACGAEVKELPKKLRLLHGKRREVLPALLAAAGPIRTASGELISALDEDRQQREFFEIGVALVDFVIDGFQPVLKDPVTARIVAALDIVNQCAKAWLAGLKLEAAAGTVQQDQLARARADLDMGVRATWRDYYDAYLELVTPYLFEVRPAAADAGAPPGGRFDVPAAARDGVTVIAPLGAAQCMLRVSGAWSDSPGRWLNAPGAVAAPGQATKTGLPVVGGLVLRRGAQGRYTPVADNQRFAVTPGELLQFSMDEGLETSAYENNVGALQLQWQCGPAGSLDGDYTKISNTGALLPASAALGDGPDDWGCTRDNATGMLWEVKRRGGPQGWQRVFTYYTSTLEAQTYIDGVFGLPSAAEVASPDNAATYIRQANQRVMCGRSNWSFGSPVIVTSLAISGLPEAWFGPSQNTAWWTGGVGYPCPFGGCWAPMSAYGHFVPVPWYPCYWGCYTSRNSRLGVWLASPS